jgi:Spy/CpxP family protein refolding chaperone
MLRKIALGLIAAASLSVAAIAPASAHGMHGGGWGHHGGWGHGYGFGGLYINTGVSDCYQQQMVQTRFGLRLRTVNVCGYNIY